MKKNALFALDTWFYNSLGSYNLEAKCEMLAELGYDGINLTLWSDDAWADVARIPEIKRRFGIEVTGVYASVSGPDDAEGVRRVSELLETMEGCTLVDFAILGSPEAHTNSDPRGDAAVEKMLKGLLAIAERRGITLSLYHHIGCWMETLDDAMRLCLAVNHPNLKITFSSHHWYLTDGKHPERTLERISPYLSGANFCGSRRVPSDNGTDATIELLDDGEQDNFYLLSLLQKTGFTGPIGVQGFSMGGDVYSKLRRSIAAYEDIRRRLQQHPEWADFRNDPIPSAREDVLA